MTMQQHDASTEGNNSPAISTIDKLLWWLAAAEPSLLQQYTVDRNRFRIIGLTVGCTGVFAVLAWTYFFSTTTAPAWSLLPLGFFMGFVIVNIDRALIKTMNPFKKQWLPLLLRMVLALVIGLFMAQPAVLYLFDQEVKTQASIDNGVRVQQKRQQLDSIYAGQKKAATLQLAQYESQAQARYNELLQAQQAYLAEADGTGGSGTKGISVIAKAKQQAYAERTAAYEQWQTQHKPAMDSLRNELSNIETKIRKDEAAFAQLLNHGFLTRIEAMQHLVAQNQAVAFRYYLIMALLMLIELMPVIVKSLMPAGPYAVAAMETEQFDIDQIRKDLTAKKAAADHDLQLRQATEAASISQMHERFASLAKAEIEQESAQWQANTGRTSRQFWQSLFKRLLR